MTISLCVVAYNEEKYIGNLLKDILRQTYPHKLTEILLIDSMSGDGTRAIMQKFAEEHATEYLNIQILNNTGRIQAAGWNTAIDHFTGDVMTRIDAHAQLPPDFAEKVMKVMEEGEFIAGGQRPCLSENKSGWGDALLAVENALFGSSINSTKREAKKEYVKTVFHASYKREVFEKAGHFNEELLRTEDNEMHYRMRKAGYKICYDPRIISYQYARSSLRSMIRQKYGNGYWIGYTLKVCPGCISWYHLIPAAFVTAILLTSALSVFGYGIPAGIMWCAYAAFCLFSTAVSMVKSPFNPFLLLMPALFLIIHVSYGIGTLAGIFRKRR